MIDAFYHLGLSISYDRVLSISTEIANNIVGRYEREGVVCPFKLREAVFTTAAVDNIDHNPSATTSKDLFHGTAISLAQHPTTENPGRVRGITFDLRKSLASKKIVQLPAHYSELLPLVIHSTEEKVPGCTPQSVDLAQAKPMDSISQEKDWLETCRQTLSKDTFGDKDVVSWAGYNSSHLSLSSHQPAIIALLPMFIENAHLFAMITHSIKVVREAIHHLNPSQTPAIAVDQPLFALAKQIQWSLGGMYSEDNLVVILGGLHIEMAALKAVGKWLDGSGWKEALIKAEVASEGVAESLISASHLART